MCTSCRRPARPRDEPADADDDDDDDVTFGEHDEFKLIPGGHAAADRRTAGRRPKEERNHFGKVDRDREPESVINNRSRIAIAIGLRSQFAR